MIRVALVLLLATATGFAAEGAPPQDILGCDQADPNQARPPYPVLFIGSSSVAHWNNLARDVGENAIRCGYSGDQTSDMIARAQPLASFYHPRRIFYYAGDNDLDRGTGKDPKAPKSPEEIVANFRQFVDNVRSVPGMAHVPISFLSIKESPARWGLRADIVAANLAVCRFTQQDGDLDFIDVFDALLQNGRMAPNCGLYDVRSDGAYPLHLNDDGYRRWGGIIRGWMGPGQRFVTSYGCAWIDSLVSMPLTTSGPYVCAGGPK